MPTVTFAFRFDPRYARITQPFGINPDTSWVSVDELNVAAQYGRWRVRTPIANIAAVKITGPYRLLKTIGPPRLGATDWGVTFASNPDRGVELTFHERVKCVGPFPHKNLTVTVEDPSTLADLLGTRIG